MFSVGIDLVEIARIERSIGSESFCKGVFGDRELGELKSRRPQSYAAAYCAKEAFAKALGTGVRGFKLTEVQLLHDDLGAPYLSLNGKAQQMALEKGFEHFSVSVSHDGGFCTAIVLAEKIKEKK